MIRLKPDQFTHPFTISRHAPACWQGEPSHSLMSSSQLMPSYPGTHSQVYRPTWSWQVAPFWQGSASHSSTSASQFTPAGQINTEETSPLRTAAAASLVSVLNTLLYLCGIVIYKVQWYMNMVTLPGYIQSIKSLHTLDLWFDMIFAQCVCWYDPRLPTNQ